MSLVLGILVALLLFVMVSALFKRSPLWAELDDGEKVDRLIAGAITWALIGAVLGLLYDVFTRR